MSVHLPVSILNSPEVDTEAGHRLRVRIGYGVAILLVVAMTLYGFEYYFLDVAQRPFSPKHALLKPGGSIGLGLGLLGTALFLGIFLYPIRKRWEWLRRRGNTRHWLDFHVLLGLSAPFLIAFHASFKFRGVAGMAFWIMAAVALSGVVGRYLYAQIPRSLNTADLSLQEARDEQAQLTKQLGEQKLFAATVLAPLFRLPGEARVRSRPLLLVLATMMYLDLLRILHIARLRFRVLGFWGRLASLGGILASRNSEVERVVAIARRQARLSMRVLFLSRTQQVFHLWHVIHRPFSYSFALLALVHIAVVLLIGVR